MSVLTTTDRACKLTILRAWDALVRGDEPKYEKPDAEILHLHGMLTPQEYIFGEALEQGVI